MQDASRHLAMFLNIVFAFSFSPEDSCERCRDPNATITTVNVPAVSAYHQVCQTFLLLNWLFYPILKSFCYYNQFVPKISLG